MTGLIALALLVTLVLGTLIGTYAIERANPPAGRFVEVEGGRLHLVELGQPNAPAVLLLHGASANLHDQRIALGDKLAQRYRVIIVDRPGHGWSDRPGGRADATPERQAELIHQAMTKIGVKRAIVFGHSWSGAVATAYTLNYPDDVSGLVVLSGVTHPWTGRYSALHRVTAAPVLGEIVSRTIIMPLGLLTIAGVTKIVFAPQTPPEDYLSRADGLMVLRPSEFMANGQDVLALRESVTRLSPRYPEIAVPTTAIGGDRDEIVHTHLHAYAMRDQVKDAKLIVLPGLGHMPHHAVPDVIVAAIDDVAARGRREQVNSASRQGAERKASN